MSAAPSLRPGQEIARYVVIGHLGSGGMGDVYEVEHQLLHKRFALKRLALDIAGDQAMVERFLREARAAAATGHPGVVDVVDLGFAPDNSPYLVMERLVGETLRHRLERGPLDEARLTRLAHQALDALAAVHGAGIVHRDIKPDNLFLCADGRLKVLDFGLSARETVDVRLTQSGAVMGTPLYMSPEQARGEEADLRADLYSLGAVMYEAAAGRPPFAAPAYSVLVAMILESDPEESPIAHLAPALRETILRALSKRPADRWADAAAMRAHLPDEPDDDASWGASGVAPTRGDLTSAPTLPSGLPPAREREATTVAGKTPPRKRSRAIPIGAGAAALVAASALAWWWHGRGGGGSPAIAVTATRRLTFDPGCEEYPRFTRDGARIVYDGVVDGDTELFALDLDANATPRRLTHAAGWDYASAISPDGRRVAYVHEDASGRTVRVLALDAADATPHELGPIAGYPAWTRDGALLLGDESGRILRWDVAADAASGIVKETVLGQLPGGARPYHLAAIDGGGVAILWWTSSEADRSALGELDPDGKLRVIEEAATDYDGGLAPSPTRRGYYATRKGATTGNQLLWRPWGGGAAEVVPGALSPRAGVDVSADGRHLVFSTCTEDSHLVRLRAGAAPQPLARGDWQDGNPRGVDAHHLLVTSDRLGRQQGWLVDLAGGAPRAVTPPDSHGATPSRDGAWVAYAADGGRGGIAIAGVDGTPPRVVTSDPSDSAPAFTRDGASIVFVRAAAGGKPHLHVIGRDGAGDRALAAGSAPATSPVDDTIAFVTPPDDDGASQVMLTDLAGSAPRPVPGLTPAAWQHPRFSADGTHLLLVRGYQDVVDVAIDGKTAPVVVWSATTQSINAADWAPDGDGVIAALADYDGDLWLADGAFP